MSVIPEIIVIPNYSPYNEFSINCTATLPTDISLRLEFTWINTLTRQEFTSNASLSIISSTNIDERKFGSVLRVVQEEAGTILIVCVAQSFSGIPSSGPLSTESSAPVNVTVTGMLTSCDCTLIPTLVTFFKRLWRVVPMASDTL